MQLLLFPLSFDVHSTQTKKTVKFHSFSPLLSCVSEAEIPVDRQFTKELQGELKITKAY